MNTIEIISNILTTIGMLFVIFSTVFKKKSTIIAFQTINQILCIIAYPMLGGWSGFAMAVATFTMNVFILLNKQNKYINVFFYILVLALGAFGIWYENKDDLIVLTIIVSTLPVISNLEYSIIALRKKPNVTVLKIGFLVSCILWAIYGFYIKSYSTTVFNVIAVFVNVIGLIRTKNVKKLSNDNFQD